MMENEKLAERLRNNDETALEEIIDRFTPLVSTIIYNLANGSMSQPDIEEITSDTFFSLWCNRDKVEKDKLKGYLCCIAKNKAKDKLKINGRHKTVDIEEMDFEDGLVVSEEIENKIITEALREALDEIGDPDKEIIIRHYYYYQSSSEIAEKTGMNSQTVKSKIRRTREKLKKLLTARGFTK
ncbi:MAG: sigma-70 family RNA polymerase sigma factor [Clostridia bacterium]|nr:sigma-70 family RNA polymerase sigma factor [Clostridia bacterium]